MDGPLARRAALLLIFGLVVALLVWLFLHSDRSTAETKASATANSERPAPGSLVSDRELERAPLAEVPVAAAAAAEVDAAAPLETRIFGVLQNASLEPIRGVWYAGVSLSSERGERNVCEPDEEGAYSFSSLAFGTYWLSAGAEGYRGQSVEIELTPETPVVEADFTLQDSVMLRVRLVTPEGLDVYEALRALEAPQSARYLVPVATSENPGARFTEVLGSLNNHFGVGHFWNYGPRVGSLPPGYMGLLVLDGYLPVWVSLVHYHRVLESQQVLPGQEEVVFVVSPEELIAGLATVRVQVVEAESGLPIPSAKVSLEGHGGFDRAAATDAEGVAILPDRMPGAFELFVRADGFETHRQPFDAASGSVTDLGVVRLEAERTVEGIVFDGEGRPVASELTLGIVNAADGSIRWLRNGEFKSKADGTYRLQGLGRHEYVIRSSSRAIGNADDLAGNAWIAGVVPFDTRSGSLSAFDLHLRPATRLVLQVADGRGDGMRFRIIEDAGYEFYSSRFYSSHPRSLRLPIGKYRIQLLDPGNHVLSVRSATLSSETLYLELVP